MIVPGSQSTTSPMLPSSLTISTRHTRPNQELLVLSHLVGVASQVRPRPRKLLKSLERSYDSMLQVSVVDSLRWYLSCLSYDCEGVARNVYRWLPLLGEASLVCMIYAVYSRRCHSRLLEVAGQSWFMSARRQQG